MIISSILLCPDYLRQEIKFADDIEVFVDENIEKYIHAKNMVFSKNADEILFELHDLTNNPLRMQERKSKYEDYRPISFGDVVKLEYNNGNITHFLYDYSGWIQLKK